MDKKFSLKKKPVPGKRTWKYEKTEKKGKIQIDHSLERDEKSLHVCVNLDLEDDATSQRTRHYKMSIK